MSAEVTPSTAAKNAALDAVVDLLDEGSTDANGDLVIQDSEGGTLATLALSNPAFGAAASGVATASAITGATAVASGTATQFVLRDRDNMTVLTGSVGVAGAALNFSGTAAIALGDTVNVSAFTLGI